MAAPESEATASVLARRLAETAAERDTLREANARLTRSLAWMSASLEERGGEWGASAAAAVEEAEAARASAEEERARAVAAERAASRLCAERESLFDLCHALRAAAEGGRRHAEEGSVDCLLRTTATGEPALAARCAAGHVTVTLVRAAQPAPEPQKAQARAARPAHPPESPHAPGSPPPLEGGGVALKLYPAAQRGWAGGAASARETASQAAAASALTAAATQRAARLESGKLRATDWSAARRAELAHG